MKSEYPTPWNFSNSDNDILVSPNGLYRLEYGALGEIAMGAPLIGHCYCLMPGKNRIEFPEACCGPAIWEVEGKKEAIPVWTRNRDQNIAVFDVESKKFTIYATLFRVLSFTLFRGNILKGYDSPAHMPERLIFDIDKEAIYKIKTLT